MRPFSGRASAQKAPRRSVSTAGGIRRSPSAIFRTPAREVDIEACRRFGVEIVRRPTGGKAVLHEQELTYAVIAGDDSPLFPPDILETYRVISDCIAGGWPKSASGRR